MTPKLIVRLHTEELLALEPGNIVKGGSIALNNGFIITKNVVLSDPVFIREPESLTGLETGILMAKELILEADIITKNKLGKMDCIPTQEVIRYHNRKIAIVLDRSLLSIVVQDLSYLKGNSYMELEWEPSIVEAPTRTILQVN